MGKLNITVDGCESESFENTSIVAGSNAVVTGGNFALATAGLMEDVVLGFLLTALLGGKLEVARGKTVTYGIQTELYGQQAEIAALTQRLTESEDKTASEWLNVNLVSDSVSALNNAVSASAREAEELHVQLRDINDEFFYYKIERIGMLVRQIDMDVHSLGAIVRTAQNSMEQTQSVTALSGTTTSLHDLAQLT
jgi:septal ring factor EnvC (AmiA/AmiB activator)